MKCRFRRHLLRGDEVTWPSEVPEDGRPQLRVPEGDDETTLSRLLKLLDFLEMIVRKHFHQYVCLTLYLVRPCND